MCADNCASGTCTPRSRGGKQAPVKVYLLDESVHTFQMAPTCLGVEMYNAVVERLKLLEADYFDLELVDIEGNKCWLDHTKPLFKQVVSTKDMIFKLGVKFYTPHPNLLEEEYTRYLFALQIKRDLVSGHLICSENTAALLASYIVQAELGDFMEEEYLDISYLRPLKLLPDPTDEMLFKVMEFHKTHIGVTPGEADYSLLDTSRKVEYYGVRMTSAKDHEGLSLSIAVTHVGISVFQNFTKINTFSWAKIRKLSFKRKKFLIKLHPENYGYYKDTVEFYFDSRDECKRFWKKCIEHHAFFRCLAALKSSNKKARVVSKGSSYRYVGRTQKELTDYVRENCTKRPHFERPSARRTSKSPCSTSRSPGGDGSRTPGGHQSRSTGPSSAPQAGYRSRGGATTTGSSASYNMNSSLYSAPSRAVSEEEDLVAVANTHEPESMEVEEKKTRAKTDGEEKSRGSKRRKSDLQNQDVPDGPLKSTKLAYQAISVGGLGYDSEKESRENDLQPTSIGVSPLAQPPVQQSTKGSRRSLTDSQRPSQASTVSALSPQSSELSSPPPPYPGIPSAREAGGEHHKRTKTKTPKSSGQSGDQHAAPNTIGRIVCIDQYSSSESESLIGGSPHPTSVRSRSTPASAHHNNHINSTIDSTHLMDTTNMSPADADLLLTDIPYTLLRRHVSPGNPKAKRDPRDDGSQSVKSGSKRSRRRSNRSGGKSSGSEKDGPTSVSEVSLGGGTQLRMSRSLDRKLAGGYIPPKSPKLLRDEYLQRQRKQVDKATIEALKAELRRAGEVLTARTGTKAQQVINMKGLAKGHAQFRQVRGTEFVSAYRLPAVNNFSAKDDTMSPQVESMSLIYRTRKHRTPLSGDSEPDKASVGSNGLRNGEKRDPGRRRKRGSLSTDSDESDSELKRLAHLDSPPCLPPRNPVYLDSSDSDNSSCDRRSRPQSVSDVDISIRTPRAARKHMLADGGAVDEAKLAEIEARRARRKERRSRARQRAAPYPKGREEMDEGSWDDDESSSWASSLDDQLSGVNVVGEGGHFREEHDALTSSSGGADTDEDFPLSTASTGGMDHSRSDHPQVPTATDDVTQTGGETGSKLLSSSTSGDELRVPGSTMGVDMSTASSSNGACVEEEPSSESNDDDFLAGEEGGCGSREPSISSQLDRIASRGTDREEDDPRRPSEESGNGGIKISEPASTEAPGESGHDCIGAPGLMVTCPSPETTAVKPNLIKPVTESTVDTEMPSEPSSTATQQCGESVKVVTRNKKSESPEVSKPSRPIPHHDSVDVGSIPFPEGYQETANIVTTASSNTSTTYRKESYDLTSLPLPESLIPTASTPNDEDRQHLIEMGEVTALLDETLHICEEFEVSSKRNSDGSQSNASTSSATNNATPSGRETNQDAVSSSSAVGRTQMEVKRVEASPTQFASETRGSRDVDDDKSLAALDPTPEFAAEIGEEADRCLGTDADTETSKQDTAGIPHRVAETVKLKEITPTEETAGMVSSTELESKVEPAMSSAAACLVDDVIKGALERVKVVPGDQCHSDDDSSSASMDVCDLATALGEELGPLAGGLDTDPVAVHHSNKPSTSASGIMVVGRELSQVTEEDDDDAGSGFWRTAIVSESSKSDMLVGLGGSKDSTTITTSEDTKSSSSTISTSSSSDTAGEEVEVPESGILRKHGKSIKEPSPAYEHETIRQAMIIHEDEEENNDAPCSVTNESDENESLPCSTMEKESSPKAIIEEIVPHCVAHCGEREDTLPDVEGEIAVHSVSHCGDRDDVLPCSQMIEEEITPHCVSHCGEREDTYIGMSVDDDILPESTERLVSASTPDSPPAPSSRSMEGLDIDTAMIDVSSPGQVLSPTTTGHPHSVAAPSDHPNSVAAPTALGVSPGIGDSDEEEEKEGGEESSVLISSSSSSSDHNDNNDDGGAGGAISASMEEPGPHNNNNNNGYHGNHNNNNYNGNNNHSTSGGGSTNQHSGSHGDGGDMYEARFESSCEEIPAPRAATANGGSILSTGESARGSRDTGGTGTEGNESGADSPPLPADPLDQLSTSLRTFQETLEGNLCCDSSQSASHPHSLDEEGDDEVVAADADEDYVISETSEDEEEARRQRNLDDGSSSCSRSRSVSSSSASEGSEDIEPFPPPPPELLEEEEEEAEDMEEDIVEAIAVASEQKEASPRPVVRETRPLDIREELDDKPGPSDEGTEGRGTEVNSGHQAPQRGGGGRRSGRQRQRGRRQNGGGGGSKGKR